MKKETRYLALKWRIQIAGIVIMLILISAVSVVMIGRQMKGLEQTKENIIAIMNGDFTAHILLPQSKWENEITDINKNLNEFISKNEIKVK